MDVYTYGMGGMSSELTLFREEKVNFRPDRMIQAIIEGRSDQSGWIPTSEVN